MKKAVVIILFLCLVTTSVFAGGSSENTSGTQTSASAAAAREAAAKPKGILAKIIYNVGSSFSRITTTVAIGLHPFPSTIDRFYDLTKYGSGEGMNVYSGSSFESSDLLIDSGYYQDSNGFFRSDENGTTQLGTNGIGYLNGDPAKEKSRWSVTAYLFIILFAAEVTFTAVFGYVMPEQEGVSVLRLVATKAAKTLVMFFVAAALPFLIEAGRYGLFKLAETYTYNPEIRVNTMFELPRVFVERMANLVDTLSWKGDASPIFNKNTSSLTGKLLGSLIGGLIFIVFEFFICIEILKTGMHIIMNVIEVYVLLAAVMILLPFTAFTPTKGMVQGCVKSLFMNLIECFIIMLIVITVIPACDRACKSLYFLLTGVDGAVATVELDATQKTEIKESSNAGASSYETTIDWKLDFTTTGDTIVAVLTCVYTDENGMSHERGYYTYTYNPYDLSKGVTQEAEQKDNAQTLISTYLGNITDIKEFKWSDLETYSMESEFIAAGGGVYVDTFTKTWVGSPKIYCDMIGERILYLMKDSMSYHIGADSAASYQDDGTRSYQPAGSEPGDYSDGIDVMFAGQHLIWLPYANSNNSRTPDSNQVLTQFEAGLRGHLTQDWVSGLMQNNTRGTWRTGFVDHIRNYKTQIMMNKDATENASTSNSNDSVIGQMLITWVLVFLPCYFVKQSSQITTGLQTGHVGMESFANAISGFTGAVKTSAQILANTAKTAARGANYVGDHVRARRDSANTSNMVSMMEASNKNTSAIEGLLRGQNSNRGGNYGGDDFRDPG